MISFLRSPAPAPKPAPAPPVPFLPPLARRLRAGMMGIVCRYAVFIEGAGPEETFGFNGSAYNCSPCYEPPKDSTSAGQRFWGIAQLNVRFRGLGAGGWGRGGWEPPGFGCAGLCIES